MSNKSVQYSTSGSSFPFSMPISRSIFKAVFLTTISSSFLGQIVSQKADYTTVVYENGRNVTEAVIRRIVNSEIFAEDYSFLLRMAYVESRFGTHSLTFRNGYFGGIWQVDRSNFEKTQDLQNKNLTQIYDGIRLRFNITWTNVIWWDLLKPLHSGLAARIYLEIYTTLRGRTIPDTINRQANIWDMVYHSRDEYQQAAKFRQEAHFLQKTYSASCRAKMDLVIGLDGSSSVTSENFRTLAKEVGTFLVETFQEKALIHTRIGMFIYSNLMYYLFDLENDLSLTEMRNIVEEATFTFGDTRVDKAMLYGAQLLGNATLRSKGVPQVLLLFQEGQTGLPIDQLAAAAAVVAKNNITTIVVGIGNDVNDAELNKIGLGNRRNVFTATSFGSLPDLFLRLSPALCTLPQKPLPLDDPYTDALAQTEQRYYVVEIPNEIGVTVFINMLTGTVRAYWSYNEPVPTAIIRDGDLDGVTYIAGTTEATGQATGLLLTDTHPEYSKKAKRGESKRQLEQKKRAYMMIEGLEEGNAYEVKVKEGNLDDDDGSSSPDKVHLDIVCLNSCFILGSIYRLSGILF